MNSFEIMPKKRLHNIESFNNDPTKVKVDWGHTMQSNYDNKWIAVSDRLPQEGDCNEYLSATIATQNTGNKIKED